MTKWIIISHPSEMRKPLLFGRSYKCKGYGYFFDGECGYFGKSSYAGDLWVYERNRVLSWFGLMAEWRCDGSAKSRIVKQRRRGSDNG